MLHPSAQLRARSSERDGWLDGTRGEEIASESLWQSPSHVRDGTHRVLPPHNTHTHSRPRHEAAIPSSRKYADVSLYMFSPKRARPCQWLWRLAGRHERILTNGIYRSVSSTLRIPRCAPSSNDSTPSNTVVVVTTPQLSLVFVENEAAKVFQHHHHHRRRRSLSSVSLVFLLRRIEKEETRDVCLVS